MDTFRILNMNVVRPTSDILALSTVPHVAKSTCVMVKAFGYWWPKWSVEGFRETTSHKALQEQIYCCADESQGGDGRAIVTAAASLSTLLIIIIKADCQSEVRWKLGATNKNISDEQARFYGGVDGEEWVGGMLRMWVRDLCGLVKYFFELQ